MKKILILIMVLFFGFGSKVGAGSIHFPGYQDIFRYCNYDGKCVNACVVDNKPPLMEIPSSIGGNIHRCIDDGVKIFRSNPCPSVSKTVRCYTVDCNGGFTYSSEHSWCDSGDYSYWCSPLASCGSCSEVARSFCNSYSHNFADCEAECAALVKCDNVTKFCPKSTECLKYTCENSGTTDSKCVEKEVPAQNCVWGNWSDNCNLKCGQNITRNKISEAKCGGVCAGESNSFCPSDDKKTLSAPEIKSPKGTLDNPRVFLTMEEKIKFSWNPSSETNVLKEYEIEIRKNDNNNTVVKKDIISDGGKMEYEINRTEFKNDIGLYYWTVRPINIHCKSKSINDIPGVASERQYFRLNYKPKVLTAKIVDKDGLPIVCKDFDEGKIVIEATDLNKLDLYKANVFIGNMDEINSSFSPFVYFGGEENKAKIETGMFSKDKICDCNFIRVQVVDKQGENNEFGVDYFYVDKKFCSKDCDINLPWFWVKGAGVMSGGDIKNNVPEKSFMSQKFGYMGSSWVVSGGDIEKGKGEYGERGNWHKEEVDVVKKGAISEFMKKMNKLDYVNEKFELVFGDYTINSNINKMIFVDGNVVVEGEMIKIKGGLYVTGNIVIKGNLEVEYDPSLLKLLPTKVTKVIKNWRQF